MPVARPWQSVLETALSLVYPLPEPTGEEPEWIEAPLCLRCGNPEMGTQSESPRDCPECHGRRWHYLRARAACRHRGRVREAVLGFKFGGQFHHRAELVGYLVTAYDRHESGEVWDGIVPVPLHRLRRRERGFNQSRELAAGLARARGLDLLDALRRVRYTTQQTQLERAERLTNLRDAFTLKPRFDVQGRHLLIIDDVYTTGATAEGCARALHAAGAASLGVLTVTRG